MTFKKISMLPAFALAAFLSPGAQANDDVDAVATASVATALTISQERNLTFGQGFKGDGAKVVAATDATNSAEFDVVGDAGETYTLEAIADSELTLDGNATVDPNEIISLTAFTNDGVETLDGSGEDTFTVGATLGAIAASQVSGDYSGTFNVSIIY